MSKKIHIKVSTTQGETPPVQGRPMYLPNPELTPGSVVCEDAAIVMTEGYSEKNRRVSQFDRMKVFRLYKIPPDWWRGYYIDHLIPLSLGGSNDLRNLWPHILHHTFGPPAKARLEAYLRKLVRDGTQPLTWAQNLLRKNWVEAFCDFRL